MIIVADENQLHSNSEIADRLSSLAQLLSTDKANLYKKKAYRRAANTIRGLGESVDELVRRDADLTVYPGIGKAISGAIREIVLTGTLATLEKLRSDASPELLSISDYPKLDPRRVQRIYTRLRISSIEALRQALENGDIERVLGSRMAQHVRQGLVASGAILLYQAHDLAGSVKEYLLKHSTASRVEAVGDYRRRVETIEQLSFIALADHFERVIERMKRYGGQTPLIEATKDSALFSLAAGPLLRIDLAERRNWGLSLIQRTGSEAHLKKLQKMTGSLSALKLTASFPTEQSFYDHFGLQFIDAELREGIDEVKQARAGILPVLVTKDDILGDLHLHTDASDGSNSIEQMVTAAQDKGYAYIGITDHSQSLKIAGGLSPKRLWKQIRIIDRLNERLNGIRILKSAEVDILADGSLDYLDDLLRELDYTVCSVHSRFALGREQQTERIMRAMDNRYFTILGHATGRLLLKRPGYEIDINCIVAHAKENGCFFEINSSPDRLDLSAENARIAAAAGISIAVSTDAHSTHELDAIRYGIEQARRAGLEKALVLNCQPIDTLTKLFRR